MKIIKLINSSDVVFIDDEDYPSLVQRRWGLLKAKRKTKTNKYAVLSETNNTLRMHRVILNLTNPKIQVDHIDGNGLNNQKSNLRVCNNIQNNRNKKKLNKPTSSKYKGVCFDKNRDKWLAHITINYKLKFLGRYLLEIEAAEAYNKAAIKYFGEFANLNVLS